MKATAELQVIPVGAGDSVRRQVTQVLDLPGDSPLLVEPHASGTNLEGTLDEIPAAVERVHSVLHDSGEVRLISFLKLETRTDKPPTLAGKKIQRHWQLVVPCVVGFSGTAS